MARVTVEDCIDKVDSRFELVLLAAQRARSISSGAPLTIDRDRDKNPVVALREIAEETVGVDHQREQYVQSQQKYVEIDEIEDAPDFGDDLMGLGGRTIPNDGFFNHSAAPANPPATGAYASDDSALEPDPIIMAQARGQGFSFDDIEDVQD